MYGFIRALVKFVLLILFRIKVINKENFPENSGVLVCLNHQSNWDVPLAGSFLPAKLHFMAKKELFDIFLFGKIISATGAFPVSRGKGDIGAVKAAVAHLKAGEAVAMFPEGTRVKKGQEHKAKPGAALISNLAGCLVLPVGICGSYKPFSRITVNIGKPYYINPEKIKFDAQMLQERSDDLMDRILSLVEECDG